MSSAQNIPNRRSEDQVHLPAGYQQTPSGTIYSTTPGGTRIIYDKEKLLALRNSPYAQTPPSSLQYIPGVTRNPNGGGAGGSSLSSSIPHQLATGVSHSTLAAALEAERAKQAASRVIEGQEEEDEDDSGASSAHSMSGSANRSGAGPADPHHREDDKADVFEMDME
ncbi:eukaryotic translation initiation factor 4E binding protein-domain-containing protein [Piptocephalis cylindrospora]|uniref:Eukaryotic translation initiation factor 4E binding protein-domain-containing protein n=1 Tax=Piptocephalis cylindrospora TaxID=1907219 RepID=A0A4V1IXN7_9FUNG|nr:eukaryotic translation initiation factor 4E binding protein-domain-containing protein [Piptocephalis cylindrospora]|eukprot:RKP11699.1 eukaryotic translation initiation factor 4E binding protein-domain-containing protein [Piptocephalis cylindrospora]